MTSYEKLKADFEALQQVHRETLHSYLQLKERYRKLAKENVEMNMALARIYTAVNDYKLCKLFKAVDNYKEGATNETETY